MLQFDKSQTYNSNAVWIDTPSTASGFYSPLQAVYSQSYDNSNGRFDLTTISSPNRYRNWLVIRNTGASLPIPSGQYTVKIYRATQTTNPTWEGTDQVWATTDEVWSTFGEGSVIGDPIYEDRAYISGSNETFITQYVSPNEIGTYTTYNG